MNLAELPPLPSFVAAFGRRLPQWPPSLALVAALEAARRLSILSAEALEELSGRRFEVEVIDAGMRCRFGYGPRGFRVATAPPDVAFRAPAATFAALLARTDDPDTLFFQRRLVIEGDTELGLRAKNLLDAVDWAALAECIPFAARFRAVF